MTGRCWVKLECFVRPLGSKFMWHRVLPGKVGSYVWVSKYFCVLAFIRSILWHHSIHFIFCHLNKCSFPNSSRLEQPSTWEKLVSEGLNTNFEASSAKLQQIMGVTEYSVEDLHLLGVTKYMRNLKWQCHPSFAPWIWQQMYRVLHERVTFLKMWGTQ